jgi:multimeric flavodoxin WrbA
MFKEVTLLKNITVLLGSPRNGGNTDTLSKAFVEPFVKAGAVVKTFRLSEMEITGCTDCRMCWKSGKPCVIDDDMSSIYDAIDASDLIVFATPLYWYSWSAQIKPVWDRLVPYNAGDAPRNMKGKQAVLIAAGADGTPDIFEGLLPSFRKASGLLGLEIAGEHVFPGLFARTDAAGKEELLQELRDAGKKLI